MLKIYADECFPVEVSMRLRAIGYDIRTCQEEKQDRKGISDENVMNYANRHNVPFLPAICLTLSTFTSDLPKRKNTILALLPAQKI